MVNAWKLIVKVHIAHQNKTNGVLDIKNVYKFIGSL